MASISKKKCCHAVPLFLLRKKQRYVSLVKIPHRYETTAVFLPWLVILQCSWTIATWLCLKTEG